MKVKVINKSKFELPKYETAGAAGLDLRSNLDEEVVLKPLERKLFPTGLFMEIPVGFEAQVRPRSGLALKKGLTVLNTPGTIDSDYRGEVGVILVNLSNEEVKVEPGERVAQLIVASFEQVAWEETAALQETERGTGGFGSTGKK